jgi:hypothetical protein
LACFEGHYHYGNWGSLPLIFLPLCLFEFYEVN